MRNHLQSLFAVVTCLLLSLTAATAQAQQTDDVSLENGTYTLTATGSGPDDETATLNARRSAVRIAVIERIGAESYREHRSLIDEQVTQYPEDVITDQQLTDTRTADPSTDTDNPAVSVTLRVSIDKSKLDNQLSSLALLEDDSDDDRTATAGDSSDASPGPMTDLGHRGESRSKTSASEDASDPSTSSSNQSANNQQTNTSTSQFARSFPTLDFEIGVNVRGGIPEALDFTIPVSLGYDLGTWRFGVVAEVGAHRPNSAPSQEGTEGDGGYGFGASLTRTLFSNKSAAIGARTRATLLYHRYQAECTEYGPEIGEEGPQCQSRLDTPQRGGALDLDLSAYKDLPFATRAEVGATTRISTIHGFMVGGFLRTSWGSTR